MRRREFIAGLGGAAAWPVVARGQQPGRMRRVGVLMYGPENDPYQKALLSAFTQSLAEFGWNDARNVRLDVRWSAADVESVRSQPGELVALEPDVVVATSTVATAAFQRETQKIPIVFVGISDPVGSRFVANLARPGGNLTGFINIEAGMGGKWLQLLTEIVPGVKRAALMFNPENAPYVTAYYLPLFEAAARSLKLAPIASPVHSEAEIETVIGSLGGEPGGALVIPPDLFTTGHRGLIISLATRNNVPAAYNDTVFIREGGLFSYGPDRADIFHRSASYVDRILRGAKPADLPVQLPVKFQIAINLKTAKALGLTVPQSILLSADEVIE
jgi:putative tryptophan/tyrosine transport system substrate-binding protein